MTGVISAVNLIFNMPDDFKRVREIGQHVVAVRIVNHKAAVDEIDVVSFPCVFFLNNIALENFNAVFVENFTTEFAVNGLNLNDGQAVLIDDSLSD